MANLNFPPFHSRMSFASNHPMRLDPIVSSSNSRTFGQWLEFREGLAEKISLYFNDSHATISDPRFGLRWFVNTGNYFLLVRLFFCK
ncbi:MAG: hypothetical protein ACTSRK_13320 [Promethearchaeota archaeon]